MAMIDKQMKMSSTSSNNNNSIHMPFCNTIKIHFDSTEHAIIVKSAFEIEGQSLYVHIKANEWRMLRVATSSFYDMVMVAVQCVDEFG